MTFRCRLFFLKIHLSTAIRKKPNARWTLCKQVLVETERDDDFPVQGAIYAHLNSRAHKKRVAEFEVGWEAEQLAKQSADVQAVLKGHGHIEMVDTVAKCREAIRDLSKSKEVGLDIEGINLGAQGRVCIIQICGENNNSTTYL